MITIPIWLALLILGLASLAGTVFGFTTAALCWSAAESDAAYEANSRMFAGADAIDALADPNQVQP